MLPPFHSLLFMARAFIKEIISPYFSYGFPNERLVAPIILAFCSHAFGVYNVRDAMQTFKTTISIKRDVLENTNKVVKKTVVELVIIMSYLFITAYGFIKVAKALNPPPPPIVDNENLL
ncbi:uncharacterized protein G2W53_017681 [Senna tora]|uniref:Uncharacterized protein n=1 Tax=Senna tora TaxID=362788 RepID=A0A834TRC0_9FABA|nr:uncharacterized protein G2W53_017681 [Senna tora]